MERRFLLALLILTVGALGVALLGWILDLHSSVVPEAAQETVTDYSEWRVLVDGFVQRPLNLTVEELAAMAKSTVIAALYCVDYTETPFAEGRWTGVRVGLILEKAGVSPEAVKVAFHAKDGYSTDLTLTTVTDENVILAYEKDGEPLLEKLRLVVPGKWGYKWISHIVRIELVNFDYKGFWESRGYSDEADIPPDP